MQSPVTTISSTPSLTDPATAKKTSQTDATASQDRFLKLLVAQLNNQDPMNPMDNAQMTSQMAQINTVSGIQQLNETMKSIGNQFASMQMLQATGVIGHEVLLQSNVLSIEAGKAGGAIELSGNADKVAVQILSPSGEVIDTMNLGAMTAGRHTFDWDASNYKSTGNATFKVTATSGSNSVATSSLARDTVVSVSNEGSAMNFQLRGREPVAYNAIKAVL